MKKNTYNFLKLLVVVFVVIFQYCLAAAYDLNRELFADPIAAKPMVEILQHFSRAVGGTDSITSEGSIAQYRISSNAAITEGVRLLNSKDHDSSDAIWITSRLAQFLGSIPADHTWLAIVTASDGVAKSAHVETIANTAITAIKAGNGIAALNTDGPATNIFQVSQMFCAAARLFPEMLDDATGGQIHALEKSMFDGVSANIDTYRVFEMAVLEAARRAALERQNATVAPTESWGSFFARHSLSFLAGVAVATITVFAINKRR